MSEFGLYTNNSYCGDLDTDGDGEIEGSDLAALRAKNEGVQKKK